MYSSAKAKIRTSEGDSDWFRLKRGVFQGETLSPKLFTIFLEDVFKIFDEKTSPIRVGTADIDMLAYADDLVVLARNIFEMQEKIDKLVKYFNDNGLIVNLSKTNVVLFKNRNTIKNKPKLFWGDSEINYVDYYKYLGVPFYSNVSNKKMFEHFHAKSRWAQNDLMKLFYRAKITTLNSRMQLFNSLVQSVLLYCSPIWGVNFMDNLEVFQANFIRKLFHLPNVTPQWICRLETNVKPIQVMFLKSLLYFWFKIITNDSTLVFKCYEELIKQSTSETKNNWFRDVKTLLTTYKIEDILDVNVQEKTDKEILQLINSKLKQVTIDITNKDVERMTNTKRYANYRMIKTSVKPENYLNFVIPFNKIRQGVQLRLNVEQLSVHDTVFKLNKLNHSFYPEFSPECQLCNSGMQETMYHILCECQPLRKLRRESAPELCNIKSSEEYFLYLKDLTAPKLHAICSLVEKIYSLRSSQ